MTNPMPESRKGESLSRRWPGITARIALVTVAAAGAALTACKKEEPPPPPAPVQAPPPPPPTVRFDDLTQEMHADPRVQFAGDLAELPEDQADMGRAVVRLADSLAKGNAEEMRSLLTRRAQDILDSLEQNEGWQDATSKIEAVRVVYVGPAPASVSAAMSMMADPSAMMGGAMAKIMPKVMEFNTALTEAIQSLPAEAQQSVNQKMMDAMTGGAFTPKPGADPASTIAGIKSQFETLIKDMEAAGAPADTVATLRTKMEELVNSSADAGMDTANAAMGSDKTGVLLAVQDPAGSYLLGWTIEQSFDKWVFTNAPSSADSRARASAWDGIGQAGFGEMMAAVPDVDELKKSLGIDSLPDEAPSSTSDQSSTPTGPRKKNTPAGPITIPGG